MLYPTENSGSRTLSSPQGVTLIEVMMSSMVVSLGILGLIALIPLGQHLTERGTRADRVASIGERVYHEAKIRGYFKPSNWGIPDPSDATAFDANSFDFRLDNGLPTRQPYMIDPFFYGSSGSDASRQEFPYPTAFSRTGAAFSTQMHRLTLVRNSTTSTIRPLDDFHTRTTFQANDDLAFERPSDGEIPSFQVNYIRGVNRIRRQAKGEYTWMIMLTPDPVTWVNYISAANENAGHEAALQPPFDVNSNAILEATQAATATDEYTAWIMILKNRQATIPSGSVATIDTEEEFISERVLSVISFISSGGYSTGEVRLEQTGGTLEQAEDETLKINNGDWICLVQRRPSINRPPGTANYPAGDVYQWYRVVVADEIIEGSGTFTRRLSIDGPDWSADPSGSFEPTHAIIVNGVVGVYPKRVRLETN